MAPGAMVSGRSVIGNNCFLGINCTVRDNIAVAEKCIIGGGAIIKKSTEAMGVYSVESTKKYNNQSINTKV
jgi:carbonic anhydrase/acetyltransferase-like protein (isoleucine patch superfamily)